MANGPASRTHDIGMTPVATASRLPPASVESALIALLGDTLALAPASRAALRADSALFGTLPELDSMAVATVLTAMEDRFGIIIDDDDVDGELFATVGSLAALVNRRISGR